MSYFVFKVVVSGLLVGAISEIARRSPAIAAFVASLPLVSILAMIWLWRDTGDTGRIADHAEATFWLVLPSMPMFLVLPALLRAGYGFWLALAVSCGMTVVLYAVLVFVGRRLGVF
jgi:hypothetical protein